MTEKLCSFTSVSSLEPTVVKEWSFKLIMLGDTNVGKTSLLKRYAQNEIPNGIYQPTIGVDFRMRQLNIDGEYVRAMIWDTAGQERFRTMTKQYYRGSHGVILVYDVTNTDSFLHVQNWLRDFEKSIDGNRVKKILVGNKYDIPESERRISDLEGQLLSIELDLPFFETSAKTGANVSEMFTKIITDLVISKKRMRSYSLTQSPSSHWNLTDPFPAKTKEEEKKRKSRCCFS